MFPTLIQELVEFDNARQRGPVVIKPHAHHYFQMDLLISGTMSLLMRDRRIKLKPGDGTLIPPLAVHAFEIARSAHHATFKFRVHARYYALFSHHSQTFRFGTAQRAVAAAIGPWSESNNSLNVHAAFGAATLCLVHAMRTCPVKSPGTNDTASSYPSPEVWAAINDVMARPTLQWTIRELAERANLSDGHFSKTFIQWFGQTPRQFLLEARTVAAARQLSSATVSIKSVARASGYASVHSFSRAFKRATGTTPAAYAIAQGIL